MVAAASTLLFSATAGQGSDRVPGRDREAMLALNAKLLSQNGVKIAPGSTSVDLPVRGSLVYRNGQLALELLKTGDGVPKAVRVLMAERDEATGLDRIRVPSVAGEPERTILINPVAPPAKSSSTGNDEPAPVTPKHTGTDITPVESITVTTTPVDDHKGLQDFIYWRPDADGTGVEPVYVVLSNLGGNAGKGTTGSLTGSQTKLPPNATPENIRSLVRENESARILSENGFHVEQNPVTSGIKNPDYKINGEIFDNYAPSSGNIRNIWREVEKKVEKGQTNSVVINLADTKASVSDLQKQFSDWPVKGLDRIIVIDQSGKPIKIK